jgi:tetratricopeptide (TPR) repeat protein
MILGRVLGYILAISTIGEPEAYLRAGIDMLNKGVYEQAVAYLDSAISLDRNLQEAYLYRGKAKIEIAMLELMMKRGRNSKFDFYTEGAIKDLNRALELDEGDARAYFERGQLRGALYDKAGRYQDFDKAIHLNPKYSDAFIQRSAAYKFDKEYQLALADLKSAINIEPRGWFYHLLGLLQNEMKLGEDACASWSQAIEKGYVQSQNELKQYCN